MPQMWGVGAFCTRLWEVAMTWYDTVPTEEESEASLHAS